MNERIQQMPLLLEELLNVVEDVENGYMLTRKPCVIALQVPLWNTDVIPMAVGISLHLWRP